MSKYFGFIANNVTTLLMNSYAIIALGLLEFHDIQYISYLITLGSK